MSSKPKARRYWTAALWFVDLVLNRGSNFAKAWLVARYLEPTTAGLGYLTLSFAEASKSLTEMGTNLLLVIDKQLTEDTLASAWAFEVIKRAAVAAAMLVFAMVCTVNGSSWSLPLAVGSVIAFARVPFNPSLFLMEREQKIGRLTTYQVSASLVGLFTTFVGLWLRYGWLALPLGAAASAITLSAISHWGGVATSQMRRARRKGIISFAKRGLPFLAAGLAAYASNLGLDVVLSARGLDDSIAPFRLSAAMVYTIVYSVPAVLARASLAVDSEKLRVDKDIKLVDTRYVTLVCIFVVVFVSLCNIGLFDVANVLYGSKWMPALAAMLSPMTAMVAVRAINTPFSTAMLVSHRVHTENSFKLIESLSIVATVWVLAKTSLGLALICCAAVYSLMLGVRIAVLFSSRQLTRAPFLATTTALIFIWTLLALAVE
ncbi:MAG: oligosaccharide flippase family protein [Myxococcota bacterium]